jgi:toxin ParE1/3/4
MGASRPELSPTARILIEGRYLTIYQRQPNGVKLTAIAHAMRGPADWTADPRTYAQSFA